MLLGPPGRALRQMDCLAHFIPRIALGEKGKGRVWKLGESESSVKSSNQNRGSGKRALRPAALAQGKISSEEILVRKEGVEPPRPFGHKILSLARLPVPPLPQWCVYSTSLRSAAPLQFCAAFSMELPAARRRRRWCWIQSGGWEHNTVVKKRVSWLVSPAKT